MREDGKIDYIEFPAKDLTAAKGFYAAAFGWVFTDYGPDYAAFDGAAMDGGFNAEDAVPAPLVILYAHDLEAMQARIEAAGGQIVREIRAFPGGRRFHFRDPAGNVLGVWSAN
ncbi:MAG: VOC family protein [Caulobacteraceae bacterium]